MTRRSPAAALLATALTIALTPAAVRAEIRDESFKSPSLGRDVRYVIDLPPSYSTGEKRYPVVYVLHGLFEGPGFWERRGLAPLLARLREQGGGEFLVVAVDGGNSFFVNGPQGAFQDLVSRDIVAHVEATYRARTDRASRALLGVSMGGYGALRIAFMEQDRFCAVATHSAMLLEAVPNASEGAGRGQMAAFHAVFGDPIDVKRWQAADPIALAAKADPKTTPALYFDCGADDRYGLAAGNRHLHDTLAARGVPHTFTLPPGDHGYEFVRARIEESLRFLDLSLRGTQRSGGAR
jgi:S-formylglutathione hydrolase FrmB